MWQCPLLSVCMYATNIIHYSSFLYFDLGVILLLLF